MPPAASRLQFGTDGCSQGAPSGLMPTRRALRDSGARLLELAIVQRGGPDAVALELGFRARRGNHTTWEDLYQDLQQVIRDSATPPGIMPSRRAFVASGRLDVYRCAFRYNKVFGLCLTLRRGLQRLHKTRRRSGRRAASWPCISQGALLEPGSGRGLLLKFPSAGRAPPDSGIEVPSLARSLRCAESLLLSQTPACARLARFPAARSWCQRAKQACTCDCAASRAAWRPWRSCCSSATTDASSGAAALSLLRRSWRLKTALMQHCARSSHPVLRDRGRAPRRTPTRRPRGCPLAAPYASFAEKRCGTQSSVLAEHGLSRSAWVGAWRRAADHAARPPDTAHGRDAYDARHDTYALPCCFPKRPFALFRRRDACRRGQSRRPPSTRVRWWLLCGARAPPVCRAEAPGVRWRSPRESRSRPRSRCRKVAAEEAEAARSPGCLSSHARWITASSPPARF